MANNAPKPKLKKMQKKGIIKITVLNLQMSETNFVLEELRF